jgi:hypothetical protein
MSSPFLKMVFIASTVTTSGALALRDRERRIRIRVMVFACAYPATPTRRPAPFLDSLSGMFLTFSRRLAWIGGVLLPALETVRRWHEFPGPMESWPRWLDDYMLGAIQLLGAWRCSVDASHGRRWLIAAWAFVSGFGVQNVLVAWDRIHAATSDPSGLSHSTVFAIRCGLVALALLGFFSAMRSGHSARV